MKIDLSHIGFRSLALLAIFAILYPLSYLIVSSWLIAGAIAGVMLSLANQQVKNRIRSLEERIGAKYSPEWTVHINDVKVGTVLDSELAAIRLAVLKDPHTYASQLSNILRVALRVFDFCYLGVPIAVFWIVTAIAIGSPTTLTDFAAQVTDGGPAALSASVLSALSFLAFIVVMALMFQIMFGLSRFGFSNQFAQATSEVLRKRCGSAQRG